MAEKEKEVAALEERLKNVTLEKDVKPEHKTLTKRPGFDPDNYTADTGRGSKDYIGKGTFGRVYKARHMRPMAAGEKEPKYVAMKIIELSDEKKKKKYQKKEIDFYIEHVEKGTFDHPNIISYYAFEDYDTLNEHCVYMELCDKTLKQIIKDDLSDDMKRHIILGICNGVHHLHQHKIIHRDINPSNILLKNVEGQPYPVVKVADFNVYAMHSGPADASHTAHIGQDPYQAKEVKDIVHTFDSDLTERATYGCSVDIWAIGAIAYEMHTKNIFNELSNEQMRREKLFAIPEKLDVTINDPTVRNFLSLCLDWKPSRRKTCTVLMSHTYLNPDSQKKPMTQFEYECRSLCKRVSKIVRLLGSKNIVFLFTVS